MKNLLSVLVLVLVGLVVSVFPPVHAEEARPLRVGVSADFEPISFVVSDEIQGIEVDFAHMVAERMERPLELRIYQFKDLLGALEAGEIDMVMSGMSVTEERRSRVRFADPYMEIGQMAIVRTEDASQFGQPHALETNGLKVGVHQGSTGEDWVLENLANANLIAYPGVEQGLGGLRNSEVDVFVHDSTTSWQLSRSFVNDNLMSLNRFLTRESVAWAVRRDEPELQLAANLILKDLKANGQVSEVIKRWLPVIPVSI